MKKLISVLLAIITIFSAFSLSAAAATTAFVDLFPEDEGIVRMIEYKKDTLSGVRMVYQAGNTLVLENTKYAQISEDTPIAIDHDFICWKDKTGREYYPGDIIKVEGTVTLYAVWAKKTDNESQVVRTVKAGIEALLRILKTILSVFEDAKDFDDAYWESKYNEQTTTEYTGVVSTTVA